jgi:hypothetical protein
LLIYKEFFKVSVDKAAPISMIRAADEEAHSASLKFSKIDRKK